MKQIVKDSIDEIRIPEREKEEIYYSLREKKTEEKYRKLKKKSALAVSVLALALVATNWNRLYTLAVNITKQVIVVDWEQQSDEDWEKGELAALGTGVVESREYQIPEGMEEKPCETAKVSGRDGMVKVENCVGNYSYLQKEYDSTGQAEEELGISVLTPAGENLREEKVSLQICEEALLKPAILTASYVPEEEDGVSCNMRITVFGGNLDYYTTDGEIEYGIKFAQKYVTKEGLEAYIYYNRYHQNMLEEYEVYSEFFPETNEGNYEYWYSDAPLLVWGKSYEAMVFHQGIRYEISGGESLEEIRQILDTLR